MDLVSFSQVERKVLSTKQGVAMQSVYTIPQTVECLIRGMGLQTQFQSRRRTVRKSIYQLEELLHGNCDFGCSLEFESSGDYKPHIYA